MKNIILTIFAIIGFATVVTGFTNIVVNDSHQEIGRYQTTGSLVPDRAWAGFGITGGGAPDYKGDILLYTLKIR